MRAKKNKNMPLQIGTSKIRGELLDALIASDLAPDDLKLVRRFIANAGEEELRELQERERGHAAVFEELAKLIKAKQLFLGKGEKAMPVESIIAQEEQFNQ